MFSKASGSGQPARCPPSPKEEYLGQPWIRASGMRILEMQNGKMTNTEPGIYSEEKKPRARRELNVMWKRVYWYTLPACFGC